MSILEIVYASAPTNELLIPTLEIKVPGKDPIRLCNGFDDQWLYVDDTPERFEAGDLSIALPARNASGQQTLRFGFAGIDGVAQSYIDAALEAGEPSVAVFREYLESDKTAPASRPIEMTIIGGQFEDGQVVFECSYYDLLNSAWPRERYTTTTAPGIKYL